MDRSMGRVNSITLMYQPPFSSANIPTLLGHPMHQSTHSSHMSSRMGTYPFYNTRVDADTNHHSSKRQRGRYQLDVGAYGIAKRSRGNPNHGELNGACGQIRRRSGIGSASGRGRILHSGECDECSGWARAGNRSAGERWPIPTTAAVN